MGLYDSIYAKCPKCSGEIEYQTKADDCPSLHRFTIDEAPTFLLADVLNSPEKCPRCGSWVVIYDPDFPPTPKRPNPSALIVAPPKGDTCKHPQGMEWWPHDEDFVIVTQE